MNNQEKLIKAVINQDISIVSEVIAGNIGESDKNMAALTAANMKVYDSRLALIKAQSIVELVKVVASKNERVLSKIKDDGKVPLYKLIEYMADGNNDAKIILVEMIKLSKNERFLRYMHRLGIKGDEIVAVYDLCDFKIENVFDALDHEEDKIISHLDEFNKKKGNKNGQ